MLYCYKNICVPNCVVFFLYSPLHVPEWHIFQPGIWCGAKAEVMPPSWAPSTHPSINAFIGLGPAHVPDQAPFNIWFEPVLPLTLVRELDHEWLVVHYLSIILSRRPVKWPQFLSRWIFFVRNYLKSKRYETLSVSIYDLKQPIR